MNDLRVNHALVTFYKKIPTGVALTIEGTIYVDTLDRVNEIIGRVCDDLDFKDKTTKIPVSWA